jgi:penicillin-binding protein 1A
MALPIWGLFMQKVLKDGTLGVSEQDCFVPTGTTLNLDCSGDDGDVEMVVQDEESLFFD